MTPFGPRKWMWAALGLTLVLGMSLGIVLDRLVLGGVHPPPFRGPREHGEELLRRLETELNLTPEQKEDLEKVLTASREKAEAFRNQTRDSYAELRRQFREDIRALLTPEQQRRLDQMMAREDAGRRERERERP